MKRKNTTKKISEASDAALVSVLQEHGKISSGELAKKAREKLEESDEWSYSEKSLKNRISNLEERNIVKSESTAGRYVIKYINPKVQIQYARSFSFLPEGMEYTIPLQEAKQSIRKAIERLSGPAFGPLTLEEISREASIPMNWSIKQGDKEVTFEDLVYRELRSKGLKLERE